MSRALRLARILRIVGRYRLDEFIDREQLPALPRLALAPEKHTIRASHKNR